MTSSLALTLESVYSSTSILRAVLDRKDMQSLPEELMNEPYSYEDTNYRPEIIVPRPKFHFEIEDERISVSIEGELLFSSTDIPDEYEDEWPVKRTSNVSILNVYDTYGLEIAQMFLVRLVGGACRETWIDVYLSGSATALGLSFAPKVGYRQSIEQRLLILSSIISLDLIRRENRKSILPCPIVQQSLPPEIVAIVTGSMRISREVTSNVKMLQQ